jgi:hypothetical protein
VTFGFMLSGAVVTVRSHAAIGDQLRPAVRQRRVGALIKPANWLFLQAPSDYSRGWAGSRILYQVDRKSVRLKIRRFSHVVNLLGQHASRPAISWSAVCIQREVLGIPRDRKYCRRRMSCCRSSTTLSGRFQHRNQSSPSSGRGRNSAISPGSFLRWSGADGDAITPQA